tara:strand:+ start:67 stop:273 length:207 start_codon:yes stop_codon:yes gene_type:complete
MGSTKREEVISHLRYIRLELRDMHHMLLKEGLLPDPGEAREVHAQLDALHQLLSEKTKKKVKSEFDNF